MNRSVRVLIGGSMAIAAVLIALPGGRLPSAGAAVPGPSFAGTVTAVRAHLEADGSPRTVESANVAVQVSETRNLRGRQQIQVSWTGAHPTGGIAADPNSVAAARQEYPVVLMQCRGIDAAGAPAGQRLDPTTCWTQTATERYDENNGTAFPAWRLDRYAAAADRRAVVSAPDPNPCIGRPSAARYVPFVAVDGASYAVGNNGCAGLPPEGVTVPDAAAPPGNTTYAVTRLDGTGSATFVIWTAQQNSSLGCSDTVPCSLVVIPILGVSCDVAGAELPEADRPASGDETDRARTDCEATGRYAPGELHSSDSTKDAGDTAVTGALWWSPSNWRNRITVALMLDPAANACDILDTRSPVDVFGSELMNQATTQWTPAFCRDTQRFKFRHVRTGEPQAKSALDAGTIAAALVSRPPTDGWAGPTAMAPVAVTGFAITYAIDDGGKRPYDQLRLTPRLLAKLLSESYWAFQGLRTSYAALPATNPYHAMAANPQDLAVDPEFLALNPDIPATVQTQTGATLLSLSADSDVMYALTSYLNADPEARAFLDGQPDPWGMVVNPRYKGIVLPEQFWPLLDDFLDPNIDLDGCLRNEVQDIVPVPLLPLVAAPMASLNGIAQAMQYALANSATTCVPRLTPGGQNVGGTLKARGRQQPGFRFMLGVTSLADSGLYGLRAAALQSTATVSDSHARFTDAANRTFVAPGPDAMARAMRLTTADETTHTWPIPYARLRTAEGAAAYPGTMVVYAAVPTTGLSATLATQLAQLIRFAATDGQTAGIGDGQLPDGYLPMTPANGLGALADYARRSADTVQAQQGAPPAVKPGVTTTPPPGGSGTGGSAAAGGSVAGHATAGVGASTPSSTPSPTPSYRPGLDLPVGYTARQHSTVAAWTLPLVVAVGLLALLVAFVTQARGASHAAANVRSRLNQLVGARRPARR